MAITITINGSVTLDESTSFQTGGVAVGQEDNNDSDLALATLQSQATSFYNRLFGAGGLGLLTTLATGIGIAKSSDTYIALSGTGTINTLGFVTSTGSALPVYGSGSGAASNLTALDGGAITLFSDANLGGRVALGVDTDGDIVFALFMDPAAGLTSAKVWMVQFEPLANTNPANVDDPLSMTGLGVGAGVSSEFSFAGLPSGQNLFGMVGSTTSALIVIGKLPVLNADGTFTNTSNTINTSQGGGNTTIGVNNQMFDAGEGAYFTFVKSANSNFLGTNLDANEADDADNMLYSDGNGATNDTIESDGAFLRIAQIQGNALASMTIEAFNITGSPQGRSLITASGQNHTNLTQVKVYNAAGTLIEDTADLAHFNSATVSVTFSGGVATVSGLNAGYKVEWFTGDPNVKFDQVLVTGVAGKFDIGGFGVNEPVAVSVPLSGVRFEDDGPTVDLVLSGSAELVVDETTLPASNSITAANLFSTNTADFGTDGEGTDGSVYKLLLADDNSGLFDTATGDEVLLSVNAAGTLITGSVTDGGAQTVFTIGLDPDTGEVTLTQMRALINPDPTDPDEDDDPLTMATANLVKIQRSLTDGDGDAASDSVDITGIFKFEDDGPSLPPATQDVLELVTDDTDITDSATLSTDDIFTGSPDYGSDGPNQIDPVIYGLRVVGTDPNSGLVDTATGRAILLKKEAGGDVVGIVDANGNGTIDVGEATVAIRYGLSVPVPADLDTETVTFTQYRAVVHDDVNDDDESTSPETINGGLVFIDQTAVDGDGDVSGVASFDLGAVTQLRDDGPAIGPIDDGLVDFELNDSVNNPLNGLVGNDPKASPYTLTSYTTSLTVGGVEVHGVLAGDAKSVTYWADTNGDSTYGNTGDTAYYSLVLGDQSGAGDYTFTVLIDPPPSFTEFTFDLLPSGANLFGVVASGNSALLVIGEDPQVNGAGNYTNLSDVIHTSQGGTGATIGVNNQMFDPGDGAYFTFINDPDPNFVSGIAGGLTATEADNVNNIQFNEDLSGPATQEVTSAFLGISQIQGGKAGVSMSIEAFNITDGPQGGAFIPALGQNHVDITDVRVMDANGNVIEDSDGSVNSASIAITFSGGVATVTGLKANYSVEWDSDDPFDQVLVTGVAGKFDVGRFGSFESHETPDQLLSFTAQVADGDGDAATDSWNIGIDGTGTYDDNSVSGIII
ncbi:MAG: DUF5801 repeats-in-toxin domain-containing protein [Sphingomicrobium sp.]